MERIEDPAADGRAERERASSYLNQHVRMEFNIPGVTFGGRYDDSPIVVRDGTTPPPDAANSYQPSACPGGRPPHAWLADGRSLYDTFHSEWTLLQLDASSSAGAGFEVAAQSLGLNLKRLDHSASGLHPLYQAPWVLIRPDQIVAWRGQDDQHALQVLRQAIGF